MTLAHKLFFLLLLCFSNVIHAYTIQYSNEVDRILGSIQPERMWHHLATLTDFPDRAATSEHGIEAANWIASQVGMTVSASGRNDINIRQIPTRWIDEQGKVTSYPQESIVLKIGNSNLPGIVIGAHLDTVGCGKKNCAAKKSLRRPGADDDGSGSVTLLEIARVLLDSHMAFKKPIYLAWYASEENDLDGSKAVITDFQKNNIAVDAVMQLDMTGYAHHNDLTLWLGNRHVNKALTTFTYQLAKKYVRNNVGITHLDDESDHWSWQEAGYKTVFPMESNCHGRMKCPYREHTAQDTMDKLSLKHMTDYLKLALAFSVELAEPSGNVASK